jgi:ABC-type Fe3+-hydroxamate transport system substrate-binding protein
MKTLAMPIAIILTFIAGLNIRPAPTPTIHQIETFVQTNTRTIIELIDRDVTHPETDEHVLYTCWTQLVDLQAITDWHTEIAYIARKWAGDTCQALEHLKTHGTY